jgi:exosortase
MAFIQTTAVCVSNGRLRPAAIAWPGAAPVAVGTLALAHLPLLAIQARLTWGHPHYRFFPLVLAGAAMLAARDGGRLGPLEPGSGPRAAVALAGAWFILTAACLVGSAWFGTIAALVALVAVLDALGGGRLVRALLPACGLLWVAIPPPLRLDDTLVTILQGTATRWSSHLLDLMGVMHLSEGNVIRLVDRRLLIEEACSGIHSLFAVLAGTIFLMLWVRRSFLRSAAVVATSVTWVFLCNILRIVIVVAAAARWGIDLLTGWRHEALGLAVFGLALGLTASTDSLYSAASSLLTLWREWSRELLMGGQRGPAAASAPANGAGPTRLPALRSTRLASWPLAAAYGFLLVAQPVLVGNQLEDGFLPASVGASRLLAVRAGDLPAAWGPFRQQGFQTVANPPGHGEGLFFQRWSYRWGQRTVVVSLDGPFQGWRELTQCYNARGWTTAERAIEPGREGEGAFVAVRLERGLDQRALLCFSHFDEHRHVIDPGSPGNLTGLLSQLRSYGWGQLRRRTYQFQIFSEGAAALTPAERDEVLAFFQKLRLELAERISRGGGGVSS